MSLPRFDLEQPAQRVAWAERLAALRKTATASSEDADTVAAIVDDVRERGDDALVEYMRRWTDPDFDASRIRVGPGELDAALEALDPELRAALETSIENVRAYQQHVMPVAPAPMQLAGAEVGLRFTPVASAGCCVPGGTAVLVSTLIMIAVPALVAGVPANAVAAIHPPPTRRPGESSGDISPVVLATCRLLGMDSLYRIGGAQGIAALAHGTERVAPVDMIAGPGNVFVQLAKQRVNGVTGTDGGFYGPSEIVTIADETADPACVAADLMAQAEHDPGKCFLVVWSSQVLDRILAELDRQFAHRGRAPAIAAALRDESAALLVRDEAEAAAIADEIAAEHVSLAVADPADWLGRLRNGGEFFLGDQTPVAAGDYYAGPSHCLPTGTTARFASGISVYTFLKRTGTVRYRDGMPGRAIDVIDRLASLEGLDAHAASVRVRRRLED
jgi:histidinol dehydrogenase